MVKGVVVSVVLMALSCLGAGGRLDEWPKAGETTRAPGSGVRSPLQLPERDDAVDLSRDSGLREIIRVADAMVDRSERQERELRDYRRKLLGRNQFADMPYADLKRYFAEPRDFISDKDRRGWKELRRLASAALAATDAEFIQGCHWQMREIAAAMRNNHRSPSPPHMDMLQPPLYYMDYAWNPIAKGERPAYNLASARVGAGGSDLSRLDPRPTTFWRRPDSIAALDVYHGFGRTNLPDYESRTWSYAGPKTSFGGCPGFEAESWGVRIKVKFAETTSEPFTARIFWALGYHVEATDYVHALRLKYDRRFFREFHMRKDVQMKVRALFVPLHTVDLQVRHDPFDYIHAAVLKTGERIPGEELKRRLLKEGARGAKNLRPEDFPENFRPEVEAQIELLITTPANVQMREKDIKSIGPWDFQSLDHAERREVRAAGLLGAWVGWFDSRFENTRLKIVRTEGTNELRHYFTDLGGGLGRAVGVLSRHCECPNDFGWRFTRPARAQGKGRMTVPFRIVDFQPIEDTLAFREMSYDDARWMARLIGQLTEEQIVQALIASGFDATEVRIFAEKLVSRRDWMIRDLDLASEIALLRPALPGDPAAPGATLSYDPAAEPPPRARLANGTYATARASRLAIEKGVVVPQLHTRTSQERAGQVDAPLAENRSCPLHGALGGKTH